MRTLRGWRQPEKALDRISLWTYYEGVELSDELARTGDFGEIR